MQCCCGQSSWSASGEGVSSALRVAALRPLSTACAEELAQDGRVLDSLQISCMPARPRSKWKHARLPLADAMVRIPACAQVSGISLCLGSLNVDWFLVAAWICNLLLRFARAEPGRAAHIVSIGFAWRAWWCRCEQQRPVRSPRAVLVSNLARVVISAQCRKSASPGTDVEIVGPGVESMGISYSGQC